MQSTFDWYSPWNAALPSGVNLACQFVQDMPAGNRPGGTSIVAWSHYIDIDPTISVADACTRTGSLNTQNYADGDEVRIPTGGTARYVVVWVTPCDVEGTVVHRCYLMRNNV
jgi:hypothetical protein